MNDPEHQYQHQVPQVYLKQFSVKIDGVENLYIQKKGSSKISLAEVHGFSAVINIFDLPHDDFELRRRFENISSRIENEYPKLINNIKNQHKLTDKDKDLVNNLVPNLLCRSNPYRSFILSLLDCSETRNKFLNEITMFCNQDVDLKYWMNFFKGKDLLNITNGYLIEHLTYILRRFKKTIIKAPFDCEWMTTDSPVLFDNNGISNYILPIEAELYLPLSPQYLLYIYHEKSQISTSTLKPLTENKINEITLEQFEEVFTKLMSNESYYIIFNPNFVDPFNKGLL